MFHCTATVKPSLLHNTSLAGKCFWLKLSVYLFVCLLVCPFVCALTSQPFDLQPSFLAEVKDHRSRSSRHNLAGLHRKNKCLTINAKKTSYVSILFLKLAFLCFSNPRCSVFDYFITHKCVFNKTKKCLYTRARNLH